MSLYENSFKDLCIRYSSVSKFMKSSKNKLKGMITQNNDSYSLVCLNHDDNVIGFVALTIHHLDNRNIGELSHLCVNHQYQRCKVGTLLILEVSVLI